MVNMWPRPLQADLPTWITGIGNPNTMRMCLERGFGFTYLSWFGAKLTGKRIFDRFWEIADQVGVPRNPYRLGFLQTVAVAESDEQAERDYAEHLEYGFRKGLGSIPMEKLGLPGGIDIRGVQALLKDPGDFGLYYQMKTATYRDLVDAGVVIAGSPATVRDQLIGVLPRVRHRQPARDARLRLAAAAPGDEEHPAVRRGGRAAPARTCGPIPNTSTTGGPNASAARRAPRKSRDHRNGGSAMSSHPTITDQAVEVWNGRLTLRVKVAGAGSPLLYLHPAAGLAWDPFLSHLAERYTVYAPEFPGTSTGRPLRHPPVDDLTNVVLLYEELVRKLGLVKPVVVGQSFGGMLACELAAHFPDVPSALVVLDPIGLWPTSTRSPTGSPPPPTSLPALLFHDPDSPAARAMLALPEDPEQQRAAIAGLVWAFGCTGKFTWPIPDRGLRDRLHRIGARTLIVSASKTSSPTSPTPGVRQRHRRQQGRHRRRLRPHPQVEKYDQTVQPSTSSSADPPARAAVQPRAGAPD